MLGFNPDWKSRDPDCKFLPKLQPGSLFGDLIFDLRLWPQHQKLYESNPVYTRTQGSIWKIGDGAGNTIEENSSIFSLIRMR